MIWSMLGTRNTFFYLPTGYASESWSYSASPIMLDTLIGHHCDCAMSYVKYNWMSRDTKRSDDDVATWMTLITFMLIIKYIWMARYTNKSSASSLRISKSLIFLEKKNINFTSLQRCDYASFCVHNLNLILLSRSFFITLPPETKIEIVRYFEQ